MEKYIGHLRQFHIVHGFSLIHFNHHTITQIMKFTLRRVIPRYSPPPPHQTHVTLQNLFTAARATAHDMSYTNVVVTTIACLCFGGLFRTYELLHALEHPDVLPWSSCTLVPEGRGAFRISLARPKRHGEEARQTVQPLALPSPANPQVWLLHLKSIRKFENHMFATESGARLTHATFIVHFARLAGLNPAHLDVSSFRAGGASYLAEKGVSLEVIQFFGRWGSNAFKRYIRSNAGTFMPFLQ